MSAEYGTDAPAARHTGTPEAARTAPSWTRWAALGTATFMASLDNLVVSIALPHIQRQHGVSVEALTWAVNAYTLPFAVLMLVAAVAGERWGRRRVLLVGLVLFGGASALAGLAPSYEMFVVARFVQGVGAALLVPLSLTLLLAGTQADRRPMVIALYSAVQGLGVALGPFIGGLIISAASWPWVLWVNVPLTVLVLVLARRLPQPPPRRGAHFPVGSLALLSLGLLATALAALSLDGGGPWAILWAALAVALLIAGGRRVGRRDHPALPARLFQNVGFRWANLTAFVVSAGVFGVVFFLTQYLQVVMGYAPLTAGLATLPWTLLPAAAAPVAGWAAPRYGMRPLLLLAGILQILGLGWFLWTLSPGTPYPVLLPGMVLAGLGMGVFFALITGQAVSFAHRSDEGVATGVNTSVREAGVLVGVASVGGVFALAGGDPTPRGFEAGLPAALLTAIVLLVLGLVSTARTPRVPGP
jgi:EmrB/QacA subfamily drug resistance transporter